jgi:hypothetical protein
VPGQRLADQLPPPALGQESGHAQPSLSGDLSRVLKRIVEAALAASATTHAASPPGVLPSDPVKYATPPAGTTSMASSWARPVPSPSSRLLVLRRRQEKTYGEFRAKRLVLEWFGKV